MHSVDGYFRNGELHQVLAMTSFHGLDYDLILLWIMVDKPLWFRSSIGLFAHIVIHHSALGLEGGGGGKVGNDGFNLPTF